MADWFYSQNGQQFGPVTDADLKSLVSQNSVRPDDLVWREGMSQWMVIRDLKEFEPYLPKMPPMPGAPANLAYQPIYPQGHPSIPPPNYLVQAILVTICCCLPFGIPAIVFAAQVNGLYQQGLYQQALEKSESAKKWCLIALVLGLLGNLIGIGLQIAIISMQ